MANTASSAYLPIPAGPEPLERLASILEKRWNSELKIYVQYQYEDGGSNSVWVKRDSLVTLVPVGPPLCYLNFAPEELGSKREVKIYVHPDKVLIGAQDETMIAAGELKSVAVEALGVEPLPEQDELERVTSLERRVDAVQRVQEESIRIRAFVSFRFNDSDSALARDIERFLSLNNVEVVTGHSYEPRRVEDKVRSRLTGVDFVVYLLTSTGDSAWVRDEIASAHASDVPVIPLVEEGVGFDQGLFGNVEWIRFGVGHIGDVWIKLTEALKYVRAERARSLESYD